VAFNRSQVGRMTRVGQPIQIDQPFDLRSIDDVAKDIASDKTGAAGE
jgi:hypothetical protein